MAKRKRKLHKIIIHPNRYLMWAVAVMIMVSVSLLAYIYVSDINIDIQNMGTSDFQYWHTYKDANLSLRYPAEWLIDLGPTYIGFGPKTADSFIVYAYSPPNDPAYDSYAKLPSARRITVDGLAGIRIPETGKAGQKIAFVKTTKTLYEFRGNTKDFDQILGSVKFFKR